MTYGLYVAAGSDWGLWDVYRDDPTLDNGPLWFAEVLLIFSLIYAGSVAWSGAAEHVASWHAVRFALATWWLPQR